MKHSIIFLLYDPDNKKTNARGCLEAAKKFAETNHEFIIVQNVEGMANAVNEGLQRATGDYFIIVSDDILIKENYLEKMTADNAVVSWGEFTFFITGEKLPDGALFGFSRKLYEKIGGWDTLFAQGYGCDDVDFYYRAREAGAQFIIRPLEASHVGSQTYTEYFSNLKEDMTQRNIQLLHTKWGHKLKPV